MHDQIIATHVVFRGVSGDYPESERTQESRIINKYNPLRLVVVWFLRMSHNVYRSLELCCVQTEHHHYVTVTLQWAVGQFAAMASGRVC